MLQPINSSLLSAIKHIHHSFFTRQGGASQGYFASLNCKNTEDDNPIHIAANRQRVVNHLGGTSWVGLHQKHTSKVIVIEGPTTQHEADAMVTMRPGLVLSIITADCAPILLADRHTSIIGAIHAGWQGTFSGIIENTINVMRDKGARHIVAAIGPCIHQESYEVGPEFQHRFDAHPTLLYSAQWSDFFEPSPWRQGHFLFNLPKLAHHILLTLDLTEIEVLPYDTFMNENNFFSYRRKTLRNEPATGCQASCIMLRG